MDFKQIQELIKMINKSNIGELTVEQKDFRITIKQKEEPATHYVTAPVQPMQSYLPPPGSMQPAQQTQTPASTDKTKPQTEAPAGNFITIKSPMIGTFYRRSGPDKPAMVEVGDEITPGKIVCIIEAMKLF